ncbi:MULTISPECIES: DeoR/GlpR family DNA-binding transcription regulator [Terrabacteria group]|uniref:DeoR/GlpR family DNA-binding transcription regulator n=1 Tax=Bacillati TaxID=1783272 RepID=UPI001939ABB1|nr:MULTISPECIES: DeoR/GlpR family DNA-binding transcription regulator [Terrabacteria group]MBW9213065.1 DeoR/GlpR family DNA-binding transcription regulator [Trueperella sp. zg.1013]QRG87440.1 DeoR/GlpR transcriptional regulator [Bulleidia sp. zg-1006]
MKVNYSIVQERRNHIMALIQKLGEISVSTLAKEFSVSELTIRRDLQYWEDKGAVLRHHGGVKFVQTMVNLNTEYLTNDKYKHAIAKYAAQYVNDGDTIFINTSSTALLTIQYIINKRVIVITNNAKAVQLKHDPLLSIVLTGGELRFPKESMVGDFAMNNLKRVRANKCFLGCSGISHKDGITTAIMAEASINETMIERTTGERFILCDYTKVGNKHSFLSGNISDINYLISDINADDEEIEKIKEANVEVIKLTPLLKY